MRVSREAGDGVEMSCGDWTGARECHSPGAFSGVLFCSHRCRINSFIFISFAMGLRWASGGHENPMKHHEIGGVYFNLKGGSRLGPTKLSTALGTEGSHRGR